MHVKTVIYNELQDHLINPELILQLSFITELASSSTRYDIRHVYCFVP
jgi:hypothetical protein